MRRPERAAHPAIRRVRWLEAFRIIPTRYPPVPLFERLGDPSDWEVLAEIESLTNPRVRDEIGEIHVVPVEERVTGPGASFVMAPFVHRRPSRFSDGSYGVYYCAAERTTAIAETMWHMGRFYAATAESALDVDMRVLAGRIDDRFSDLRDPRGRWRRMLAADDWSHSQKLGRELWRAASRGVVYPSVRHRGGRCLGAFLPRAVHVPGSVGVLRYHWDGKRIDRCFDYLTGEWTNG